MSQGKQKPHYLILYKCNACGQESGFTELDVPQCRYCKSNAQMQEISKQELTPEVMAARLKAVTNNMMKNMESAFQTLPDLDKDVMGENVDAEEEMLKLMAKIQKLRDQIQGLELRDPADDKGVD
jgi:DNA-directed RNA polymerase subunit RPC12/RpoP